MGQETIDSRQLLVYVYDQVLARGTPPTSLEIADHFGATQEDALHALREMDVGKTLLPNPHTGEIWMAGPFSAAPTPYEVSAEGVQWWANCAWDMLGIPVVAGRPVHIVASCTDCGERMVFDVDPIQPALDVEGVVHFLVPARRWYEDIGFT
jgi:hypothetical protein